MSSAVYRMYDADDRLLYVGCSVQYPVRLANHETKPWWRDVVRITLEHLPSERAALEAEGLAQERENPVYNIVRNGRIPNSRERRAEAQRRWETQMAVLERDRKARGVYAVRLKCHNCYGFTDELPLGVSKADGVCVHCGVRFADSQEQAA